MPSLPMKYVKHPKAKGSPLYGIVQDLRNGGITLNATCAWEAVKKAGESYLAMRRNENHDDIPNSSRLPIRLHNRHNIDEFFEKDGTYYMSLRLFPREKITLPFYPGDYQGRFLSRIVDGKLDYGTGELVKYPDFYSLNLTVKREVDIDYEPETFIGVDLGLNVLAWAIALDADGGFLDEIHFDGGQAGWVRDRLSKKRKRLQREGNIELVRKIKDYESRWMENENHVISRRITEFAEGFEKPIILLEDIDLRRMRAGAENPKVHSWRAGDLRNMIEYKALEAGILAEEVDSRHTSQRCKECGHVSKENRDGIEFNCVECGYSNHADFNAAWNLASQHSRGNLSP